MEFRAGAVLAVSGTIDARGGGHYNTTDGCGSGGGIKLASQDNVLVGGAAALVAGGSSPSGSAGNGRWAIQSWNGTKSNGTTPSIPAGVY